MRRFLFLFQFLLLTTISWGADESLIREADQRREYLSRLYNYDKNDPLIAQASQDLVFLRDHALWNYYYDTWLLLVNTYVFSGKVNTGLQEVKRMHQDATDRDKKYGLALANYAMGIAYLNMGYTDEAIDSYRQSLRLIKELDEYPSCTSDVFSYYYLSCSEMHLGLGLLDEAEQDIKEVEKRADGSGDFIPMAVLHAYAQLYLQRKDYAKAYDYSTRYYDQVMNYGDISSILIAQEQRAEILRGLGRYEEAAQMYKNVHENTDSLYKRVDDTLMIQTSEQDVVLALSHLLDNAMKFTPSGGSIRLSCAQEDTLMKIVVEDTGCGVPAEKAEEIFGEFVQLDEFKDGVGIGLPLSRYVARRLGGDIILDTSYKEGARFILTLPV